VNEQKVPQNFFAYGTASNCQHVSGTMTDQSTHIPTPGTEINPPPNWTLRFTLPAASTYDLLVWHTDNSNIFNNTSKNVQVVQG
jgi:hypothetical protein